MGKFLYLGENQVEEDQIAASRMVQQMQFEFFSKPSAPSTVILASSSKPWGQKQTTLTQELIRRLSNCRRELSCSLKQKHLNRIEIEKKIEENRIE